MVHDGIIDSARAAMGRRRGLSGSRCVWLSGSTGSPTLKLRLPACSPAPARCCEALLHCWGFDLAGNFLQRHSTTSIARQQHRHRIIIDLFSQKELPTAAWTALTSFGVYRRHYKLAQYWGDVMPSRTQSRRSILPMLSSWLTSSPF